jgi:hypothetical protein
MVYWSFPPTTVGYDTTFEDLHCVFAVIASVVLMKTLLNSIASTIFEIDTPGQLGTNRVSRTRSLKITTSSNCRATFRSNFVLQPI